MKLKIAAALLVSALTLALATPASASGVANSSNLGAVLDQIDLSNYTQTPAGFSNGEAILHSMAATSNLDAYLETLSMNDLADFKYAISQTNLTIDPLSAVKSPSRSKAAISPVCWNGKAIATQYVAGTVVATWEVQGVWCTLVDQIVSAQLVSTPVTYLYPMYVANGPLDRGSLILNNQARFWGQYQFNLQVGPVVISSALSCLRYVGAFDGHSWASTACGAY